MSELESRVAIPNIEILSSRVSIDTSLVLGIIRLLAIPKDRTYGSQEDDVISYSRRREYSRTALRNVLEPTPHVSSPQTSKTLDASSSRAS